MPSSQQILQITYMSSRDERPSKVNESTNLIELPLRNLLVLQTFQIVSQSRTFLNEFYEKMQQMSRFERTIFSVHGT